MTPDIARRLLALPALRRLAEAAARETHDATVRAIKARHHGSYGQSLIDALPPMWADVDAHLTLLCDLTRPASRDAVARLVAEAAGLECGATEPDLGRYVCGEHCCDGEIGRMVPCARPVWSMMGANETQMVLFADCPDPAEWDGDERIHVPGISAITDPTEALTAIALHVLERTP